MTNIIRTYCRTWLACCLVIMLTLSQNAFAQNQQTSANGATHGQAVHLEHGGVALGAGSAPFMHKPFNICRWVDASSAARDYLLPDNTQTEWEAFISYKPADVKLDRCCLQTQRTVTLYSSDGLQSAVVNMNLDGRNNASATNYNDTVSHTFHMSRDDWNDCNGNGVKDASEVNTTTWDETVSEVLTCGSSEHWVDGAVTRIFSTGGSTAPAVNAPVCAASTWVQSGWSACSATCGGGTQTQGVTCMQGGVAVSEALCHGAKPASSQACNTDACAAVADWSYSSWGTCTCGGTQTRSATCMQGGVAVDSSFCAGSKIDSQSCTAPDTCSAATCPAGTARSTASGTCVPFTTDVALYNYSTDQFLMSFDTGNSAYSYNPLYGDQDLNAGGNNDNTDFICARAGYNRVVSYVASKNDGTESDAFHIYTFTGGDRGNAANYTERQLSANSHNGENYYGRMRSIICTRSNDAVLTGTVIGVANFSSSLGLGFAPEDYAAIKSTYPACGSNVLSLDPTWTLYTDANHRVGPNGPTMVCRAAGACYIETSATDNSNCSSQGQGLGEVTVCFPTTYHNIQLINCAPQ